MGKVLAFEMVNAFDMIEKTCSDKNCGIFTNGQFLEVCIFLPQNLPLAKDIFLSQS